MGVPLPVLKGKKSRPEEEVRKLPEASAGRAQGRGTQSKFQVLGAKGFVGILENSVEKAFLWVGDG